MAVPCVARATGRHDEAVRLYEDAARRWDEFGCVLELAHALLGLGRCRAALGRSDAGGPLAAAADLFALLGAGALAGEAGALFGELGSTSR